MAKRGAASEGRRFEAPSASGGKFWCISVDDEHHVTTSWGKLGNTGQSKVKPFASAADATKFVDSQVKAKTKQGYVEQAATVQGSAKKPAGAPLPAVGLDAFVESLCAERRGAVTDEELRATEAALGVKLPELYVALCTRHNGSTFTQPVWVTPNVEVTALASVGELIEQYETSKDEWGVAEFLIPLAGDGHGWVCMDYREAATRVSGRCPIVACFQDDDPEFHPVRIADDFDTLLSVLVAKKGVEPDGEEGSGDLD